MANTIIFYLFISPVIIILIVGLVRLFKPTISNAVEEITRPKKGHYNYKAFNLLDLIKSSRVYHIHVSYRFDNSTRYLKVKYVGYDCESKTMPYVIIPNALDYVLKKQFPNDYTNDCLKHAKLKPILLFIIENCFVFSYTDYPKDNTLHYQFEMLEGNKKMTSKEESAESIYNQIISIIEPNSKIIRDYITISRPYQSSYLKLVRENGWTPQTSSIPKKWLVEAFSREWEFATTIKDLEE